MVNLCELEDDLSFEDSRNDGFFVNHDLNVKFGGVDGLKVDHALRSLFDQVFPTFLKEVYVNKHVYRPFPPKLGNGQDVDLFKLFWVVRVGGYDSVSMNGLEFKLSAPLKLIYVKYLKEFDECLSHGGFKDKNFWGGKIAVVEKFELFSGQLERFRCSRLQFNGNKGGKDIVKNDKRVVDEVVWFDYRKVNGVEIVGGAHKRNREEGSLSLSETVNCDRGNGIRMAKDGLFAGQIVGLCNEAFDSEKMHNVIYNDDKAPIHLSPKRKRCSQRLVARSTLQEAEESHQTPKTIEIQDDPREDPERLTVREGPQFQAVVPEWTGVVQESDPKWLGTPMWLLENDEKNVEEIGKGRKKGSCECRFPGSADCVRFHVAENRVKVKCSLGPVFYKWKFDVMGEEVSLSWSPDEEDEFKSLVMKARYEFDYTRKSKHGIMKRFWSRALMSIPAKSKQNLVSYYFNVFVLRRRCYQNRVTPENVDSDDDEQEFGIVGGRLGYERIYGLTSKVKCSKNMQCIKFEC